MPRNSTDRNIFDSVALKFLLGGLIPSFLLRTQEEPPHAASLNASLSLNAKPLLYGSHKRLVIHGLERSGTGFCSELIIKNVKNAQVYQDAKHKPFAEERLTKGPPWFYAGSNLIKYIICVKHPYSWFLSYERYHKKRCTGRIPGQTMLTNICPPGLDNATCYINTFNSLYSKWLSECSQLYEYAVVRYEDMLEHPKASLDLLCARLDLDRKSSFTEVNKYINNFSGYEELSDGGFSRKDYYLEKKYLHDLSPEKKATIDRLIDKSLVHTLGYSLEI